MTDPTATADLGRQLIDTFGKGWEKLRVEVLTSIFADDAVFIETPFAQPVQGIEGIRAWWADVPYHQSEVTFHSGEIFVVGPWFSTEFKCVFRRRRTGDWVDARGAVFCETRGEKVSEMRMYWHRHAGGNDAGKS